MARFARIVVPGCSHHVTQRGNRRQRTFFCDQDYQTYCTLLSDACREHGVQIWAYCLMPNHVHLILVPQTDCALSKALGQAHRQYSRAINFREGWRGYLWQGRFASFPMEGAHLLAAAQYVELNPVRARLVRTPEQWTWSSARAHLENSRDICCDTRALLELAPDWRKLLDAGLERDAEFRMRSCERTGRPLGPDGFVRSLERMTGRRLERQKPGRKTTDQLVKDFVADRESR